MTQEHLKKQKKKKQTYDMTKKELENKRHTITRTKTTDTPSRRSNQIPPQNKTKLVTDWQME